MHVGLHSSGPHLIGRSFDLGCLAQVEHLWASREGHAQGPFNKLSMPPLPLGWPAIQPAAPAPQQLPRCMPRCADNACQPSPLHAVGLRCKQRNLQDEARMSHLGQQVEEGLHAEELLLLHRIPGVVVPVKLA